MTKYFLYWNPLERVLWGVALAFSLMCALLYVIKGWQKERSDESLIMYGFAAIFLSFFLYRVVMVILQYVAFEGQYVNGGFYVESFSVLSAEYEPPFELVGRMGNILYTACFCFFFFTFERVFKKTRYLLTVSTSANLPFHVLLPYGLSVVFYATITFSMTMMFSVLIFAYFSLKSPMEFKSISSLLILSMLLTGGSQALANPDLMKLEFFPIFLAPIFLLLGVLMGMLPVMVNPKHFSRALVFWIILGGLYLLLLLSHCASFLYLTITRGLEVYFFLNTATYVIVAVYFLHRIFKNVQEERKKPLAKEEDSTNILGMFSKPKDLTEEEVSL